MTDEHMKLKIDGTVFRFIVVGVVNTLFGTAIMFVFYNVLLKRKPGIHRVINIRQLLSPISFIQVHYPNIHVIQFPIHLFL